jgi:hypothetical protein
MGPTGLNFPTKAGHALPQTFGIDFQLGLIFFAFFAGAGHRYFAISQQFNRVGGLMMIPCIF